MLVGAKSFGFQVMALNVVSFKNLHSTLVQNQRPLAKDSSFTFLSVTFPSCSGGWQREGKDTSVSHDEMGGVDVSPALRAMPARPAWWQTAFTGRASPFRRSGNNKMRSLGLQAVISSPCTFAFSGPCSSFSNSNIASIGYCLHKREIRAAEIASVSQTSQSFWG